MKDYALINVDGTPKIEMDGDCDLCQQEKGSLASISEFKEFIHCTNSQGRRRNSIEIDFTASWARTKN